MIFEHKQMLNNPHSNILKHKLLSLIGLIALVSIVISSCSENNPVILESPFFKNYGGSRYEYATSVQQTDEGGYVVAGYSNSTDGEVLGNHGGYDYWIIKLGVEGSLTWQKSLGGYQDEYATSIQQTKDGGYVVAGYSESQDGDVTEKHFGYDYWIVRLDNDGSLIWQKSFGWFDDDYATSIQETEDGGFIVVGYSESGFKYVPGKHGGFDYWILKLDSNGSISWHKFLGGSGNDYATSVQTTNDGGYVIAGYSNSDNGDITRNHGGIDYWIIKLNSEGSLIWQNSLGGSNNDYAYSIQKTNDGGYVVAGATASVDGDITKFHEGTDYWITKLGADGSLSWQKLLGGSSDDYANFIQTTDDDGFVLAGYSNSLDGDVTGNQGGADYWITKLSTNGSLIWQKTLGGSGTDIAHSIQQTEDGGYVIAGYSSSKDGDVIRNLGGDDFWVIKLDANGNL